MTERTSNLIGGASGILATLASQTGFWAIAQGSPSMAASTQQIRDFLHHSSARVYSGDTVELLALVLLVVFAGRLWAILRRAEGGSGWLSTTGLAAIIASIAVGVGGALAAEATAFYAGQHGLDPTTTAALLDLSNFAYLTTGPLLAIFFGATAIIVLRLGGLPRWLGWFAAVLTVAFPATLPRPTDLAYLPHMLVLIWITAVSIILIAPREPAPAYATAQTAVNT